MSYRRFAFLKMVPAIVVLASLCFPFATCHDANGVEVTLFRGSGGGVAGIPSTIFFVWPAVFVVCQLVSRRQFLLRTLVALEPLLAVFAAAWVWIAVGFVMAMTFGEGNPRTGVGTYIALTGLVLYFAVSLAQNIAWIVARRRTISTA